MPNKKRVQAKQLSPVTAHLLECALPALANSWYQESFGLRLKDPTDRYPWWFHQLACVAHEEDDGSGFHYPMDEALLAEWIRTDHRRACFVIYNLSGQPVVMDDYFDALPEALNGKELLARIMQEVKDVYEANEYDRDEIRGPRNIHVY
jgi:hypothetical protein